MNYNELLNKNGSFAPIQITHDFEFVALNLGNGYTEIRDMDKQGKIAYMKGRVDKLRSRGYGGIAANVDFKNYLKDDEAFEIFFEVAKYAKSLGMLVWVYDEQYYPTGGAGSLTLAEHPEAEALGLAALDAEFESDGRIPLRIASPYGHSELKYALFAPVINGEADLSSIKRAENCRDLSGGLALYLPEGKWKVWCFFFRAIYENTYLCQGLRASRRYINVFDRRATERFLEVTYGKGYLKGGNEEFAKTVDAIFTDEPHFPPFVKYKGEAGTRFVSYADFEPSIEGVAILPYIPWVEDLEKTFGDEYGYDLITALPHLFEETRDSRTHRRNFYTLLSRLCREAFIGRYRELLGKMDIKLSGHYYTEETFDFHPLCFGDIIEQLSDMDIPGCDNLSSAPEALSHCIASKLASSAAHLVGKDKVMIEASNMIAENQDLSLDDLKGAIEMMFINGINVITSYYGEDMLPPDEMSEFARFISDLSALYNGSKYRVDTLLYYPFEIYAENSRPSGADGDFIQGTDTLGVKKTGEELMKKQVLYDLTNRRHLLEATVCDGYIEMKNGERIRTLVFPNVDRLDPELSVLVTEAKRRGVAIIKNGDGAIAGIDFAPQAFGECEFTKEAYLAEENPDITLMHRSFPSRDLFHLVNVTKEPVEITLKLRDNGDFYALIDVDGESISELSPIKREGYAEIKLALKPTRGAIIMRYKES